jgi:hypothetical protein
MIDKPHFDLDAALSVLEQGERTAWPKVSESLQMRVLGDAAEVAAEAAGARIPAPSAAVQWGGFRWFGIFDVWSGAAVATVALCLFVSISVGYEAGPEVLVRAGLDSTLVAFAADDGDFEPFEDML